MQTNFKHLVPLLGGRGNARSWQAEHVYIFPTEPSLRWFLRRHKARLVEAGALVMLRGSWHVDPPHWEALLPELLRQDAQAALAELS